MNIKYIWLLLILFGFTACDDDKYDNPNNEPIEVVPGTADFSRFVAVGASLNAGYTDGALFIASQNNSLPIILSERFALAGGGEDFSQPFTNDNIGGLLLGGNQIANPRLFFDGSGPAVLPGVPTTEVSNIMPGPYNNMGVPGAKSFHLLAKGYGNIAGLALGLANPYFVRMASNPNASIMEDVMAQDPTFFMLWAGSDDVLGYAVTGGDGTDPITPQGTFDAAYGALIATLTSGGANGVVGNIPYVTSLPYFTTIPYNPVPLDNATATLLNGAFAPYNGGLAQAEAFGLISADERTARTINFVAGENAVTLVDEYLTDLSALGLPSYRQSTADDLLVLTSSSFIGTLVGGNPQLINGVSVPLDDKWVLTPSEQSEIMAATDMFNMKISSSVNNAGLAFFDANAIMQELADSGIQSDGFTLTADLVLGGAISLDGVHPTARGYSLIGNEILKAIDATYGSNFEEAGALNDIGDYPVFYSTDLQ